MNFVKYNSIRNSYDTVVLNRFNSVVGSDRMVALEKIHGANFSFIITKAGIECARRTDIIKPTDGSFFGHLSVFNKYKLNVQTIFELITSEFPDVVQVNVFGELFGGHYKGKSGVHASNVQAGVNYHPDNEFLVFDIMLTYVDGKTTYLPVNDMMDFMLDSYRITGVKLMMPPVIGIGTLADLVKIDPLFYTNVPKIFGIEDNSEKCDQDYAEGFVIRGYDNDYYSGETRVILKQKNSKYGEKDKVVQIKAPIELTDAQQELLDNLSAMATTNRVNAVLSKDIYTSKQFGKLMGDVTRDILDEYNLENGTDIAKTDDWLVLQKLVMSSVTQAVRSVWVTLEF